MTFNVQDLLVRVRERIHDRDGNAYDDAELLRSGDDALRQMFTKLRIMGDGPLLDYVEVPITSMQQVEQRVYSYALPDQIGDIQHIELLVSGGTRQQTVPQVSLEEKGVAAQELPGRYIVWHWGPKGAMHLRGVVDGYQTMRVWYTRQLPPLFYSTVSGGSTTSITIGTPTGAYKARDDWYSGYQFEVVTGAAANVGQVRRASAFSAGVLTTAAWPAAVTTGTIAMVVPLPDEHHEYLSALITMRMLRRSGSAEEMGLLSQELEQLQVDFEAGIARRASGEPPRMSNGRRHR